MRQRLLFVSCLLAASGCQVQSTATGDGPSPLADLTTDGGSSPDRTVLADATSAIPDLAGADLAGADLLQLPDATIAPLPDLSVVDLLLADLSTPIAVADLSPPPDTAAPAPDLTVSPQADLTVSPQPDLTVSPQPDLAMAPPSDFAGSLDFKSSDLANCAGGFISNGTCPLACSPLVESVPPTIGGLHIAYPNKAAFTHNPPSSGEHWAVPGVAPAPWGRHDEVVEREAWVHNAEHGYVMMLYNCPPPNSGPYVDGGVLNDCTNVVAGFQALMDNYPRETWCCLNGVCSNDGTDCGGSIFTEKRIVITPDPNLPGKMAMVAWGWDLVTDTFDYNAFDCFLRARIGKGPENQP